MSEKQRKHVSYLLRLWQAESDGALVWRASLESASDSDARIGIGRPGERWGFAGLAELFAFLEREVAAVNARKLPKNALFREKSAPIGVSN